MPIVELIAISFVVTTVVVLTIMGIGSVAEAEHKNKGHGDNHEEHDGDSSGGSLKYYVSKHEKFDTSDQAKGALDEGTFLAFFAKIFSEIIGAAGTYKGHGGHEEHDDHKSHAQKHGEGHEHAPAATRPPRPNEHGHEEETEKTPNITINGNQLMKYDTRHLTGKKPEQVQLEHYVKTQRPEKPLESFAGKLDIVAPTADARLPETPHKKIVVPDTKQELTQTYKGIMVEAIEQSGALRQGTPYGTGVKRIVKKLDEILTRIYDTELSSELYKEKATHLRTAFAAHASVRRHGEIPTLENAKYLAQLEKAAYEMLRTWLKEAPEEISHYKPRVRKLTKQVG